ncbi:MAG: VWA domain-containing protein [Phycisphaerae bacterium]
MAVLIATWGFRFSQPWWLAVGLLIVPLLWMGWRNLRSLGRARQITSLILRALVIALLAVLLARPNLMWKNEEMTLITVFDRSRSVPEPQQKRALQFLQERLKDKPAKHRLAVIDTAEYPTIAKLPSVDPGFRERALGLRGTETDLAAGFRMALTVAPPDSAVRILLASDGNENLGDLREVARAAAANGIPIDVIPLRYNHQREIVFRRIVAPSRLQKGQTVNLRMVINSTHHTTGRLQLTLNNDMVDLAPDSPSSTIPLTLRPGTNVESVQIPLDDKGIREFVARFIPDEGQDTVAQNNQASAVVFVSGPGHTLVVDSNGQDSLPLMKALAGKGMELKYLPTAAFPSRLPELMNTDCIVLVNTPVNDFSELQQKLMVEYVQELGGGLVMVGGADGFGAGGWIGSRLANILPVDPDPPQRKEMPRGALVLVIDRSSSMMGQKLETAKKAAMAAARGLSRFDDIGVVVFDTGADWAVPLQRARNRRAINKRISNIRIGGGTDVHAGMLKAAEALRNHKAGARHVILLTDGQTAGPPCRGLARKMRSDRISVSTVAVGAGADHALLQDIAKIAAGRYYPVTDPQKLPQIFIKEARTVLRSLIQEEIFAPKIADPTSELVPPGGLPQLGGYVLTNRKGGFNRVVLASHRKDPILATGQYGLGRCVAFTSSADSRWAANWIAWGGFDRFWRQVIRHAGKTPQGRDCEIYTEVQDRDVLVTVEALDREGRFVRMESVRGRWIGPKGQTGDVELRQVGPGQYRGKFPTGKEGSYLVNVQYSKGKGQGSKLVHAAVNVPFAPEFKDLTDNEALLRQVADMTGGRVLSMNSPEAELYDRANLKFPETLMPLTEFLILIWLGVFLTDVAVRRVSVDFRRVGRRAAALIVRWLPNRQTVREDDTLGRLKARRQELLKNRTAAGKRVAGRRYQARADRGEEQLDMADVSTQARDQRKTTPPETKAKEKTKAQEGQSTGSSQIDRLLKAKKRINKNRPE